MDKQRLLDKIMIYTYNKIYNDLMNNKNEVRSILNKLNYIYEETEYSCLKLVVEDLKYLIETLDYVYISCISENGTKNNFYPFTSFYREIISTIIAIHEKIDNILEKNKFSSESINNYYDNIKVFMESELQWRNCLEHDIDPFYNNEIFNIIKELNISKIVKYTSLISDLIEQINLSGPRNIIYKQESVNYKVLSLECRKELISQLNEKYIKIFKMINEISYISMNESLSEEGRNIVDLGIKYLELNKCIYYTYNGLNVINNEYTGLKRDTYSYFVRMSIIIYYRVFDKLGLYLNNRLGFGLSDKYLKKVVKEINIKNLINDEIASNICELESSDEYKELNRIRQRIIHDKKAFIDYKSNSDSFSSLMVSSLMLVQNIIYSILTDFFNKNSYEISYKASNEAYDKLSYKKL